MMRCAWLLAAAIFAAASPSFTACRSSRDTTTQSCAEATSQFSRKSLHDTLTSVCGHQRLYADSLTERTSVESCVTIERDSLGRADRIDPVPQYLLTLGPHISE